MNEEHRTRSAAKRRIAKPDCIASDERQMTLVEAQTMPSAERGIESVVKKERGKDVCSSAQEEQVGSANQVRAPGAELKALRVQFAAELRGLQQAMSNELRVLHQELATELRAHQLENSTSLKSHHASVIRRLDAVLALVEHESRIATVSSPGAAGRGTWSRTQRVGAVIATVLLTGLVLAFGLGVFQ